MRNYPGRGSHVDGVTGAGPRGMIAAGSSAPGKRTLTEALPSFEDIPFAAPPPVQAKPLDAAPAAVAPASEVPASRPGTAELAVDEDDRGAGSSASRRSQRFAGDPDLIAVIAGAQKLARGDRGPGVRKIQLALRDMGYLTNVTGAFDDRTEQQVKALQRSGGAFDSGSVDQATMAIFERRFTMRTPYVEAARDEAPNLTADPDKPWDPANPPGALTRHTHTLSDAEQADALASLSPASKAMPAYQPTIGGKTYQQRLDPMLRKIVRDSAARARDKAAAHKHPKQLFSLDVAAQIGGHSKRIADLVYGNWAVRKAFVPGTTLQDKFTAETERISSSTPDEQFDIARDRLDYLWRTEDGIEALNREHHVDRSRPTEQADVLGVLTDVTTAMRDDLLAIQRAWPGSTSKGKVFIQLHKANTASGNRTRRWRMFSTLVHEYLHTLANPGWLAFRRRIRDADPSKGHTLGEGVTEFLTRNVLSTVDSSDPVLRRQIEGDDYDEDADPPSHIDRGGYQAESERAEQLVAVVGVHNLYAAYFAGQTHLVGG
jgi:hypothetical protein